MYFVIAGWGHGEPGPRRGAAVLPLHLPRLPGAAARVHRRCTSRVPRRTPSTCSTLDPRRPPRRARRATAGSCCSRSRIGLAVKTPVGAAAHLAAARAHRRARGRVGDARRGAAEDGHLRLRPHRDADAARRRGGATRSSSSSRGGVGALRRAGRPRPAQPQADDRLHLGQPHGLRPARRRRRRDRGRRRRPGPHPRRHRGGTQMVSHGLLTGALFLLAGVLLRPRPHLRDGRLLRARRAARRGSPRSPRWPRSRSLGLPGLSGFIAEFQIFTGTPAVGRGRHRDRGDSAS